METGQSVGQKKERGYIFAVFSWGSAAFFYLIKFCQLPNKYLLKKQVHPEGVSNKRVRHFFVEEWHYLLLHGGRSPPHNLEFQKISDWRKEHGG